MAARFIGFLMPGLPAQYLGEDHEVICPHTTFGAGETEVGLQGLPDGCLGLSELPLLEIQVGETW